MTLKIFSHRGLVDKNAPENSLKAFKNAYEKGSKAIELDIWYLKNQLILSHNKPKNLNDFDKLENLFLEFKNKFEYWLDFKNLNRSNASLVMSKIKTLLDKNKIKPQNLYFAPFITDFDQAKVIYKVIRKYFGESAQIVAVIEKLPKNNYQKYYKQLKEGNIFGLSIQYKNINSDFRKVFADIKIFAWTVNERKAADLLDKIGVENIASDNNKMV